MIQFQIQRILKKLMSKVFDKNFLAEQEPHPPF